MAEAFSLGMIRSRVKGATKVVAASQRVRYALKLNMSVVQVSLGSQATSYAISSGKKTLNVELRRLDTRCSQTALPFVLKILARTELLS